VRYRIFLSISILVFRSSAFSSTPARTSQSTQTFSYKN